MVTKWSPLPIKEGGTDGTTPKSARRALGISEGVSSDNFVSVKDFPFGAVGDGVTDDTAAVVAFLLAISGKSGYMPAGTYKVTSTLSLTKNTLLYGDGANATIISYTGAGVAMQAVGANDSWKSTVRDLKITTTTGTHGLRLKDLNQFTLIGIFVTGFSIAGLHLTGTTTTGICIIIQIFGCWFNSNLGDGLLADNVNAINQITIHGNDFEANSGRGIAFPSAGNGISIVGNDIEGNGGTCELFLDGAIGNAVEVTGNYFESSSAHSAIICGNANEQRGISITGNLFQGDLATTAAITLGVSAFVRGIVVSGNVFSGNWTNAISASAVVGATFGPNYLQGSINHVTALQASNTGIRIFNIANRKVVAYSAAMAIDASTGEEFDITATNGTAFTILNPSQGCDDMIRIFTVRNASGGALGAVTWDTLYKLSAWTSPANGFSRSITFKFNGTNWVQVSQTGVDVPN